MAPEQREILPIPDRQPQMIDTSMAHLGFRCVARV